MKQIFYNHTLPFLTSLQEIIPLRLSIFNIPEINSGSLAEIALERYPNPHHTDTRSFLTYQSGGNFSYAHFGRFEKAGHKIYNLDICGMFANIMLTFRTSNFQPLLNLIDRLNQLREELKLNLNLQGSS